MKKILFSVALTLGLVACSHDEVIDVNRNGDEIKFGVVTDVTTRAADVYCNNNMPGAFNVWAIAYVDNGDTPVTHGAPYIVKDAIVKDGTAWKNTSGVRYWPNGTLKFWAAVNEGDYFEWNDGSPYIEDYTVPTNVAEQKDLLYAVTDKLEKGDGQVTLNFRHALSQVVFRAQNTNANLYVEISGVKICNLANVGTLDLTNVITDGNIVNHNGAEMTVDDRNGWKTTDGDALAGGETDYPVTFTKVAVPGDSNIKPLTSTNDTDKEFSSNAMLLLPQKTTAWDPITTKEHAKATGTYFLVNCRICNVTGETYDPSYEGDVELWNDEVAIPAEFDWKEGKKYVYTFVFGKDNGGYTPGGDPVLTPVTFNVTVDDFVPVANQDMDIEMKTEE